MHQDPVPEYHEPVMAREVTNMFESIPAGTVLDATYGGGGHTRAILTALDASNTVFGVDRDQAAIERFVPQARLTVAQGRFGDLAALLDAAAIDSLSGALFDLGVSSHQLDQAARGFSYRHPGPLDMRMGDGPLTAGEIVNEWSEAAVADVLRTYGEERFAGRIARAICEARPISDTVHLAEVVKAAIPAATRRSGGHPARRTFQALRIVVNDELAELERGLDAALERLAPGGRCVVISYHSLEDRIVKRRFTSGATGCTCPPELPACVCGKTPELRRLTRKPVRPSADEVDRNPRARSARLRAVEKVAA